MAETTSLEKMPRPANLLHGLTNWALFSAGIVNLVVGTVSAINAQTALAATSLTAGLVLLFGATIDRFESLKGLGVEAKTRQLDQKIHQADLALSRLKELAELTGASLVDLHSKMGRWDSAPTPHDAYELAQKVRSIMAGLGSEATQTQQALKPWVETACRDLANALVSPFRRAVSEERQKLENERASIPQPLNPNDPVFARTTAAIFELGTLYQRTNDVSKFDANDFPDRFLKIFDNVPATVAASAAHARTEATKFAPGMRLLREKLELDNPDEWFSMIDEHRNRERRGG